MSDMANSPKVAGKAIIHRMVMPDHVPQHEAPGAREQAFAFSYGYIKALLQTVYGYHAVSPTA